jgi:5-oxoprolinase (ATP-hydrolysing) subunit A
MSLNEHGINNSLKASLLRGGLEGAYINCDMGEGAGNDILIMPFINAANIACGYHAGDADIIRQTIETSTKYNVAVGAHVSFLDRTNFGRTEMQIPGNELYDLVTQQLYLFEEIASGLGVKPFHVKPHGALYNMSARDPYIAAMIAMAIKEFDQSLVLFGLSGSQSITEAKNAGLQTMSEVFADRSYQDDGSLTPRSQPGALITDVNKVVQQVLQMVKEGTVSTITGKTIPILAETICVHGDGEHAVEFVKAIHHALQ